ncbi:hypothetical protein R83H12_02585 [Fibrobacteria bacterium R8-3-H12]
MNTRKLTALFLAVFAIASHAETAAELATTINSYGLTALVNGNTVTVTGTKTNATTMLILNTDEGVSVIWQAELTGGTQSNTGLITKRGIGSFEVQSGKIEQSSIGGALYNAGPGTVNISGGEVLNSSNYDHAIRNDSTGAVNISGGKVQARIYAAVCNFRTGKITVSGSAIVTSAAMSTRGTIVNRSSGAHGCRCHNRTAGHRDFSGSKVANRCVDSSL